MNVGHYARVISLGLAAALLAAGCGGQPNTTPAPPGPGSAAVDSVQIRVLESFPVQIHAVAQGHLADACTRIDQVTQQRVENEFDVTITTARAADEACAQVLTPFEEVIRLDVAGLSRGTYTVTVNGAQATFELTADNSLPAPAAQADSVVAKLSPRP